MGIAKDLLTNSLFILMMFALLVLCNNTGTAVLVLLACLCMITNYMNKYRRIKNEMLKQREYFINTLSHDLRVSTLAQIRGLDLLKNDEEQQELVSDIKDSCKYTLDMITMLLNTYKFENGEQILSYEEFLLGDLIEQICHDLSEMTGEKGVTIHLDNEATEFVNADKSGISKMVLCLLTTAILNSDRDSEIKVFINKLYNNFEVTISYKGVALTDEECNRMFSSGSTFSTVGHGIRMHFCKKILDFHGGDIKVFNYGGVNSFTFTLPVQTAKNTAEVPLESLV